MRRIRYTPVILFCLCFLAAVPATKARQQSGPGDRQQKETVRLQLKWQHQFQFAGYYAAMEKGFYAEEGLDVELLQRSSSADPAAAVLDGRAEYGVGDASLVRKYLQEKPLRVLASIFQHSPLVLITRAGGEIQGPEDLPGKTVMGLDRGGQGAVRAMLCEAGVNPDSIKSLPHSLGLEELQEGRVQAMLAYKGNEPYRLREQGFAFHILDPRSYGIDFYGDNLFTDAGELRDHPQRAEKFLRASLRGWRYALEHKEEIIDVILEKYNPDADREKLRHEAGVVSDMCAYPEIPLGRSNLQRYDSIAAFYKELGFGSAERDVSGFVLNPGTAESELELSPAEREFINRHKSVTVASLNNFPPFSYSGGRKTGRYKGFTVDLLEKLGKKSGLDIQPRFGPWSKNLEDFKAGEVDMITAISWTEERKDFTLYTEPYYTIPTVVYTREDFGACSGIESLFGKRVAIEKDIYYEDILRGYDRIDLVEIRDTQEMMKALSFKKVDAVVTNMNIGNFQIKKLLLDNVKLAGEISLKGIESEDLRIGIRKELPLLHGIIKKAMDQISEETLLALQNKWVGAGPEESRKAVSLTPREKNYLSRLNANFRHIRIALHSDWHPMESLNGEGRPEGILVDLLDRAADNLGLPVIYTPADSFQKSLDHLRHGSADVVSALPKTAAGREELSFSEPVLSLPLVIATKSDRLFIKSLDELDNKTVGVLRGLAVKELIGSKYPQLRIKTYDSVEEGLSAVSSNEIFGFVDTLTVIGTCMQKHNFLDVKIAGKTELSLDLRMAGLKKEPVLLSLLNKALSTLSPSRKEQTINNWKSIKLEKGFNYMLLWKVLAGVAVVVLAVLYWNRRLNLLNSRLTSEVEARTNAEQRLQDTLGQVRKTSEQLSLLLNNSGQAFMLIDEDLLVDPNYSRECINIFRRDVAGEKIQDLLFSEDGFSKTHFAETLYKVMREEDDFKQDMIISLLPKRFFINNRHLEAEYKLLSDCQMMVVITDITEKIQLEQAVEKEHKRLSYIVSALENKNDLISCVAACERFIQREFFQLTEGEAPVSEKVYETFRRIHTFKGLLNQYEMPHSPGLLHEIENCLSDVINNNKNIEIRELRALLPLEDMQKSLETDKAILEESLDLQFFAGVRDVAVPVKSLLEMQNQLEALCSRPDLEPETKTRLDGLLKRVMQLRYVNFKTLLDKYPKYLRQLSERFGKAVYPVQISGADLFIDPDRFDLFIKSLVHVFRNCLVHGIEDPDSRAEAGKDERGMVYCRVDAGGGELRLVIGDDGGGIDTDQVRRKALQSGAYTEAQLQEMTEEEIRRLIFSENLSTKVEADHYAGRGMGLSAVLAEIEKLGGSVHVSTTRGQGAEFMFILPLDEHCLL